MNSELFYRTLSANKRVFSRSPIVRQKLNSLRKEEPWIKKDGTRAKVNHVFYLCEKCQEYHKSTQVEVDHIEPVIPVQIPGRHMSLDVIVNERLMVTRLDQLQVLCKRHHREKSSEENRLRREWTMKEKHIVFETISIAEGKRYIGTHTCVSLDDGFLGDSAEIRTALTKYGKDNFYRKVLYVYDNLQDAKDKEKEVQLKANK